MLKAGCFPRSTACLCGCAESCLGVSSPHSVFYALLSLWRFHEQPLLFAAFCWFLKKGQTEASSTLFINDLVFRHGFLCVSLDLLRLLVLTSEIIRARELRSHVKPFGCDSHGVASSTTWDLNLNRKPQRTGEKQSLLPPFPAGLAVPGGNPTWGRWSDRRRYSKVKGLFYLPYN